MRERGRRKRRGEGEREGRKRKTTKEREGLSEIGIGREREKLWKINMASVFYVKISQHNFTYGEIHINHRFKSHRHVQ